MHPLQYTFVFCQVGRKIVHPRDFLSVQGDSQIDNVSSDIHQCSRESRLRWNNPVLLRVMLPAAHSTQETVE